MEGSGQTLYWFSNEKVILEVPYFQRPYVWNEEDWEQFISSIKNSNDQCMPFIGSFILQEKEEKNNYLIIDGQQRITTMSIFIKAYLDNFAQLPQESRPEFVNFIYKKKLVSLTPKYEPRLTPSSVDEEDFNYVMDYNLNLNSLDSKHGKIIGAYKHFKGYIESNAEEENVKIGIKLLTSNKFFIAITLNKDYDDEQKIFDSVNTLGRDLTNSDIIKNYLYQKIKELAEKEQIDPKDVITLHKKYWMDIFFENNKREFWEKEKILGRIKTNNLEAFLKDYATIKTIYIPSETGGIEGLAKSYKKYIDKINKYEDLKSFAEDISEYANCYYDYTNDYEKNSSFKISDSVNTTLLILDKTETSTFNPYVMKLLKEKPNNYLELFESLQKFLVQRMIYKAKTKNYNKVCEILLDDNKDRIKYLEEYNENEAMGLNEYPNGLKKIYNKPATLILFLIEMIRRKGEENLYSDTLQYNKSLEHVMPQDWKKWSGVSCYKLSVDDGKTYIEVNDFVELTEQRKNMISSIGNMALLNAPLNSRISNEVFKTKIEGNANYDGIRKYVGNMSTAKEIVSQYDSDQTWNEKNIYERNNSLLKDLNNHYHFVKRQDNEFEIGINVWLIESNSVIKATIKSYEWGNYEVELENGKIIEISEGKLYASEEKALSKIVVDDIK